MAQRGADLSITIQALEIAKEIPVVEELYLVFIKVLKTCEEVQGCRKAIASLEERVLKVQKMMLEEPNGLALVAKRRPELCGQLQSSVQIVVDKYEEICKVLEPLRTKSTFFKLFLANAANIKERLDDLDAEIVAELKNLSLSLQVASFTLQIQTFDIVTDLQDKITHQYGGQEGLLSNEAGMQEVAQAIGMEVADVRASAWTIVYLSGANRRMRGLKGEEHLQKVLNNSHEVPVSMVEEVVSGGVGGWESKYRCWWRSVRMTQMDAQLPASIALRQQLQELQEPLSINGFGGSGASLAVTAAGSGPLVETDQTPSHDRRGPSEFCSPHSDDHFHYAFGEDNALMESNVDCTQLSAMGLLLIPVIFFYIVAVPFIVIGSCCCPISYQQFRFIVDPTATHSGPRVKCEIREKSQWFEKEIIVLPIVVNIIKETKISRMSGDSGIYYAYHTRFLITYVKDIHTGQQDVYATREFVDDGRIIGANQQYFVSKVMEMIGKCNNRDVAALPMSTVIAVTPPVPQPEGIALGNISAFNGTGGGYQAVAAGLGHETMNR
eukprot:gene24327-29407_t